MKKNIILLITASAMCILFGCNENQKNEIQKSDSVYTTETVATKAIGTAETKSAITTVTIKLTTTSSATTTANETISKNQQKSVSSESKKETHIIVTENIDDEINILQADDNETFQEVFPEEEMPIVTDSESSTNTKTDEENEIIEFPADDNAVELPFVPFE